jgi:cytochrome c-type protein NapC
MGSDLMRTIKTIMTRYWSIIRSRPTVSLGVVAVFFFLSGIAYMRLFDYTMAVTNTEAFCIGCHEMKDHVYPAYTKSIHYSNRSGVRATCPDCHVPHEWSDKVVRKVQASREVWGKLLGTIDTPEKFAEHRLYLAKREWKRFKQNDSLECRNCHDESFFAFERQGAPGTYMHTTMLAAGSFTCIDCHKGIAHVLPEIDDLELLSPAVLEPQNRAPFDHSKMTQEATK